MSGLPENMFYWQEYFSLPYHLARYDCLDPSLGYNIHYNNQYSVIIGKSIQKYKRKVSVGILGGSTSDSFFSAEVSWPQQLIDVASEQNISLSIYNGAVSGYNVGQEVIKFIRDMSFDDIDVLISFSSINECTSFNNGNGYFIPQIQADFTSYILNKMNKSINLRNDIFYGYSEKDIGKHWWHYENILYSICKEQNIIFRAILQPLAYDKKLTPFEKNALFNISQPIALDRKDTVDVIRNYARSKMHQSDWIVDFSNIFSGREDVSAFIDNCHLTTDGNRIIAEAIFGVINNSISS